MSIKSIAPSNWSHRTTFIRTLHTLLRYYSEAVVTTTVQSIVTKSPLPLNRNQHTNAEHNIKATRSTQSQVLIHTSDAAEAKRTIVPPAPI
ncbi:hypothetical protein VTL71DRAFT_11570 [Oculimacula yallundae]|uniref:Uncharacterized protein n=1 Tax=Oculimacula yallundae TaxID=86028 RepID=A0ABR4CRM3_9HELO